MEYLVLPAQGVYASYVITKDKKYCAAMYIGTRPTFDNENDKNSCEVFLIDFEENIYDQQILVQPVRYLREDKQFDSIDKLREQISKDVTQIKDFLQIEE